MPREDLPKNVRRLVQRYIDSVQQVELLALLQREPDRDWTANDISRTLHIPLASCEQWLARYAAEGLVDRNADGVRHATAGRHAQAADDLVDCWARRRLALIDSIYNKPNSAA